LGPTEFGSKEAPGRLSVTMRKVFEWESGSISKRHARRTVWPQVVFHTRPHTRHRPVMGIGRRRLAVLAGEPRLCGGSMIACILITGRI
jgi:hypothetical protein